tara:strand:+ start:184 stop:951 length:768 start_codon:yes stop_codon:yes gene_type:complete
MRKILKNFFIGFSSVCVVFLIWHFAAKGMHPILLPGPIKVGGALIELAQSGMLWDAIKISLTRVFSGWLLGSSIAIPLGLFAGTSLAARAALDPFIHFFRFVPALALVSLFILWFGVGELAKVNLIAFAVGFVTLVTTASGASSIDSDKLNGAKSLGANHLDLFLKIILPATLPSIFVGMRLALANAFLVIVAAEALAAQEGIGFLIWNARTFFRTDFIFVGIMCFGGLGFICDRLWKLFGRTIISRYLTKLGNY